MASSKIILTPKYDSYNSNPEPHEFEVDGSLITIKFDGTHGERVLTFHKVEFECLVDFANKMSQIRDR